jgi:very-short-patch-repair endonuclease
LFSAHFSRAIQCFGSGRAFLFEYFIDICSIERRLIIELDGCQPADRSGDDEARTAYLTSRGYRVLRFWNDQVLASADQVPADIEKLLSAHFSESRIAREAR